MTLANWQQPCLQCVDVVDRHQIWSAGRSLQRSTQSGCRCIHSFHCLSGPIAFDMFHSRPLLPRNGSVMTTAIGEDGNRSQIVGSSMSKEFIAVADCQSSHHRLDTSTARWRPRLKSRGRRVCYVIMMWPVRMELCVIQQPVIVLLLIQNTSLFYCRFWWRPLLNTEPKKSLNDGNCWNVCCL